MSKKDIILLWAAAVLFVLLFSFSTSPLYVHYWGSDSAQFQTIGKVWAMGKIPYRDIFDHKGPVIFLVNMLGYKLWGRTGVAMFQVIVVFCVLGGVYRILLYVPWKGYWKYGVLSVCTVSFSYLYSGGNMCEEYCLPFLVFSAYWQYSFLRDQDRTAGHNVWTAFFYGVSVSVCILTRATNSMAVLCGMAVITVILLQKKLYRNLFVNALFFMAGVLSVVTPFAIYFGLNGASQDFLFGTLGYNFIYASDMTPWITGASLETWFNYFMLFFPAWLCFPAYILALCNKNKCCALYYLIVGLVENMFFCSGALYQHYVMIALPNVAMFMCEWGRFLQNMVGERQSRARNVTLAVGIIWLAFIGISVGNKVSARLCGNYGKTEGYEELMEMVPDNEYGSVMAYGGGSLKDFYLRYDTVPCYKYFVLQEAQGNRSLAMAGDIVSVFSSCNAKYILTDKKATIISEILKEYYDECGQTDNYVLYRLKGV